MNYKKIYNDLCESRKGRGLSKEEGYELHHIVPRSLGGDDTEGNIVKLTYKEHFLAHKLLPKTLNGEDKYKMIAALRWMSCDKGRSKDYEKSRYCLDKFKCKHLRLFKNERSFLNFDRTVLIGGDSVKYIKQVLNLVGFNNPLKNDGVSQIKTVLVLLFYAYNNNIEGVTGLRSKKNGYAKHRFIYKLEELGLVEKGLNPYEQGYYHYLTEKGFRTLSVRCKNLYCFHEQRLVASLSGDSPSIREWNKKNPNNMIQLVATKGKRCQYMIKPFGTWNISFLDLFSEITPRSLREIEDFVSNCFYKS